MTPAQIRELADNLPHDNAGVCDTSAAVLWACADLLDGLDQRNSTTDQDWVKVGYALRRIEDISP